MDAQGLGKTLAAVLPAIKTKLQLSGLALVIAAWLITQFAQPGNTSAMLTGGAIGVSMIIFGQLFHFLADFPSRSRATVFLGAFAMFCTLVVILLITTIVLLSQPKMDVTLEEAQLGEATSTSVVKGYRVKVSQTVVSPEEVKVRRARLAGVIARSLENRDWG